MAWAPDYITSADLKTYLHGISDSVDDAVLALAISAASRAVDQYTGRQFGQVDAPEERRYTAEWDRRRSRWIVWHDDLMSVSGFGIQTDDGAIDAYDMAPINASQVSRPWTHLIVDPDSSVSPTADAYGVTITGVWGWTSVPTTIKQATSLQASRLFKRRDAPFGVAGSPDLGSELRLLAKVDPDVAVTLTPYVRWWGAA